MTTTTALCQCGCGVPTTLATQNHNPRGWVKGQPVRWLPGHQSKTRTIKKQDAYRMRYVADHPKAAYRAISAHILIAEAALSRYLPDGAEVHHVDENKQNNAGRNLVICQDRIYHTLLHARARIVRAGGHPDHDRICSVCHRVRPITEFGRSTTKTLGTANRCRTCNIAYGKQHWAKERRSRNVLPTFVRLEDIPYRTQAATHAAAQELANFINELPDGFYHATSADCELAAERMLSVFKTTLLRSGGLSEAQ